MDVEETVPEIVELKFSPRPWWIFETTAPTVLIATFADGKQAWVGWNGLTAIELVNAGKMWYYFMVKMEMLVLTLEHIYLRDIKKVPRFQRVEHFPVRGIE
jgi:hypothetical protein